MRFLLAAVLVLAACGGKGSPEPAWPKSAGHVPPESWEEDGGESLEPQGDTAVESGGTGGEEPVDPEIQALIDEALTSPTTGDTPPPTTTEDEMIIIDEGDPPPPDADAPPPPPPP